MSTTTSTRALYARRLVREKLAAELNDLQDKGYNGIHRALPVPGSGPPAGGHYSHDNLPHDDNYKPGDKALLRSGDQTPPTRKVCIVGAGAAGLYIGMLLDSLKIPGLTYDILEASSRVGGRAYTHHFSKETHDYYDVGAMRYPDIPTMKRTFDLFRLLETPLRTFYMTDPGKRAPNLFNDRLFVKGVADPYHVGPQYHGSVPEYVLHNSDDENKVEIVLNKAFGPYKEKLAENFDQGFKELMKADDFSTREYLKRGGPDGKEQQHGFFAIQWMETQDTSTNLFDQAFTESVMDSFDFDNPKQSVDWKCIEGGTSVLTDAMQAKLSTKVQTNKRVHAISIDPNSNPGQDDNMSVTCADELSPRTGYSTVFNTTTLGCLGRMDLRGLNLHPSQKDAIRSLHYDDSVKVALKFTYPWWIVDSGITKGGIASTDLPLRTCVYPSYSVDDAPDKPAVLLASYTWAQDARRLASLVDRRRPGAPSPQEAELVELILRDLARLHAETTTYERIRGAFTGVHHAYSWSDDPRFAGAFALFGPGQFSNLYPYLSRPAADSKFHIVGEASSAHHAWVVGALDSAYMAVYRFLYRFGMWDAMKALEKQWGLVEELEVGVEGTVHLQVLLGSLQEHVKVGSYGEGDTEQ